MAVEPKLRCKNNHACAVLALILAHERLPEGHGGVIAVERPHFGASCRGNLLLLRAGKQMIRGRTFMCPVLSLQAWAGLLTCARGRNADTGWLRGQLCLRGAHWGLAPRLLN